MLANGGWDLTLILLTWTVWRASTSASKWRMGFNSAFKGLKIITTYAFTGTRITTCGILTTVCHTPYIKPQSDLEFSPNAAIYLLHQSHLITLLPRALLRPHVISFINITKI